jgi:hypothetical protein
MTTAERTHLKHCVNEAIRARIAAKTTTTTQRRLDQSRRVIERLRRHVEYHRGRAETWRTRYERAARERDALWEEIDARRRYPFEPYLTQGARDAARARTFRHHSARTYRRSKKVG